MIRRVGTNWLILGLWLCAADVPAAEDTPRSEAATVAVDVPTLVRQLGDERFATRESATARLIQLGRSAKPALEEGRAHADREIRYRSARILSIIEELDFQRRLAAFAVAITAPDVATDVLSASRLRQISSSASSASMR